MILFSGEKLRELRETAGLTQSALASKTGLHIVTIGYYEIGKREPKATQLKLLADALGVNMEAFFITHGKEGTLKRTKKGQSKKQRKER